MQNFISNKHKHNNPIKFIKKRQKTQKNSNEPLLIVMSTTVDGGEGGGGGMTPTGGLGPPPFLHLEVPEHLFLKTARE